jgi:hypothetical protein
LLLAVDYSMAQCKSLRPLDQERKYYETWTGAFAIGQLVRERQSFIPRSDDNCARVEAQGSTLVWRDYLSENGPWLP